MPKKGCKKKGGVCKRKRTRAQTQTNADFRLSEKGPKTQVKARNREQPQTNMNKRIIKNCTQKAAGVWKKDVWDFQAFSQTFFDVRFSLGNEGKTARTWTPRLGLELPDVLLPDIRDLPMHPLLRTPAYMTKILDKTIVWSDVFFFFFSLFWGSGSDTMSTRRITDEK